MAKLLKMTGDYTILDNQKHLSAKQAAGLVGVHEVIIWKAMRTGRLRYMMALTPGKKKHPKATGFIRVTTKEWIEEWRETLCDKNHQTYNGKPMFDREAGEMSSSDVREYLGGWSKNKFMYYVYRQAIKFTQKGYYYVFYRDDVEEFKRMIEETTQQTEALA